MPAGQNRCRLTRLHLAVVVACVAATTGAASAAPPPYVIHGDRSIGGITLYRSEMADAVARFGEPTSTRVDNERSCVAEWRGIGLVINFFTFDGPPCVSGGAIVLTITSRKYWRTSLGLRVGDSLARAYVRSTRVRRSTQACTADGTATGS